MKTPQKLVPRWMRAASLAFAIAIFPIGFAQAHEQCGAGKKEAASSTSVEEYRRAAVEIRTAVENGKVSREDAEKRLVEMRKAIGSEQSEARDSSISVEEYRCAEVGIREAVEAGKVSREDAETRLIEMRKMIRCEKSAE